MCTLIAGLGVLGPRTLLVGANRDESPGRPSAGPGVLRSEPRVVGGRDLKAGGTWLAIRDARMVTALMNRRPDPDDARDPSTFRSRGLLCLDAAAEPGPAPWDPELARALAARDTYGSCTLVGMDVDGTGWAIHAGPRPPSIRRLEPGWHVITHAEADDPREPRTRSLLEALGTRRPGDADAAITLLRDLLRRHGEDGSPPVCLHRDAFPTVSSSILALGAVAAPQYLHAPGPPCITPYADRSELLSS
jgi:uncharacterized protein with NRDE domain